MVEINTWQFTKEHQRSFTKDWSNQDRLQTIISNIIVKWRRCNWRVGTDFYFMFTLIIGHFVEMQIDRLRG